MKVNPGKPNRNAKLGGELPYKKVDSVIGGPPCNDPQPGLNPGKGVTGQPKLPTVKE